MNIVRHRGWFFLISALVLLPSVFSLLLPPTLRAGIDFTGGAALTVQFEGEVSAEAIRQRAVSLGHDSVIVQPVGDRTFFVRVGELTEADVEELTGGLEGLSPMEVLGFDAISAVVGGETVRNAIIAVVVAAIAIMFYITWAFRHVPRPFRYGVCAMIALVHDVLIVLGVFSILGKTVEMEVNAMFIIGILTVIGYSVNDTIVVFDRIRENVARYVGAPFDEVVSVSVRETIGRSLNTSMTLLAVVTALLLFGGSTIQPLLLVMLVGVIVGTYSSIFIASLLLVSWEMGEIGRFFRRLRPFPARRA